ncbi:TIGR03747 family integrating conjugative element membrane protein [Photobacterium sp. GB-72]|uniref:TIGR03747 family integrating conjugative element membrane protein n=1 Tax=Photobacterium sp. GB-72 TaxID=2022105 RepID=UPI000D16F2A3|nr:TIGR03747 family integrating conjugative element membrane protein [Photobacterium sp. GB-72]PSV27640.1 TIGR03747 family integrating conjugative element membrane protein [Photobacterium sp. GB-72]
MSNTSREKETQKDKRMTLLTFCHYLITTLCVSIMISIAVEWLLMTFWRPEQGSNYSRMSAITEMGYLNKDFAHYVLFGLSPSAMANVIYEFITGQTYSPDQVHDLFWMRASPSDNIVTSALKLIVSVAAEYGLAMIYVIITLLARLSVLIFSLPLFLMVYLAALLDGFVERELRRMGGDTESGLSYHLFKSWIPYTFFGAWFIYMACPVTVHPSILSIFALSMFICVYLTAANFKKYF